MFRCLVFLTSNFQQTSTFVYKKKQFHVLQRIYSPNLSIGLRCTGQIGFVGFQLLGKILIKVVVMVQFNEILEWMRFSVPLDTDPSKERHIRLKIREFQIKYVLPENMRKHTQIYASSFLSHSP